MLHATGKIKLILGTFANTCLASALNSVSFACGEESRDIWMTVTAELPQPTFFVYTVTHLPTNPPGNMII